MLSIITDIQTRGRDGMTWLNSQTGGWFLLLFESLRDVLSFKSSLYAAAMAYFTLLSVFPLLLLIVAIASFWFDPYLDNQMIMERLEFVVPALNELLGANLERIYRTRGAITRLSAVLLIWSASSIFYMLTRSMDNIWEEVMIRPAWRHRAMAVGATLGVSILLLIGSFAWSVAVPVVNRLLPERIIEISPYLGGFGSAIVSALLFMVLYKMLPHATLSWGDVLVGAIIAGVLWELAKHIFFYFVSNFLTSSNLVYGSLTTIIAFLTWAYVSMLIFLFGGHVNERYRRLRLNRQAEATRM
jgi:membrane protein